MWVLSKRAPPPPSAQFSAWPSNAFSHLLLLAGEPVVRGHISALLVGSNYGFEKESDVICTGLRTGGKSWGLARKHAQRPFAAAPACSSQDCQQHQCPWPTHLWHWLRCRMSGCRERAKKWEMSKIEWTRAHLGRNAKHVPSKSLKETAVESPHRGAR